MKHRKLIIILLVIVIIIEFIIINTMHSDVKELIYSH